MNGTQLEALILEARAKLTKYEIFSDWGIDDKLVNAIKLLFLLKLLFL